MKLQTAISKCASSDSPIKSKVVRIDRQFAQTILQEFNGSNRPHSKALSKLYAADMLRAEWKTNGEPLIFGIDEEGNEHLISGQHRLHALLLAHEAVDKGETWGAAQLEWDGVIVTGVSMDTADSVDNGKSRSHADVLYRDPWLDDVIGEWGDTAARRKTFAKVLAGAARQVWLMQGGATVSSAPKFIMSEMLGFLQVYHPELPKAVTSVLNANAGDGGNKGLKMSLAHTAAVMYAACCVEAEDGDHYTIDKDTFEELEVLIDTVAVGTGYEKGSAAHALVGYWNQLLSSPGSKDRDREWIGPFIKAIKLHLEGATGVKPSNVKLTKKEFDSYSEFPILLEGWHSACYEAACAAKAAANEPVVESTPEVGEETANENGVIEFEDVTGKVETPKPQRKKSPPRKKRKPSTK